MSAVTSTSRPTFWGQYLRQERSFYLAYGCLILLFLVMMQVMEIFPPSFGAALLVLMIVMGITVVRPGTGLAAVIVLTVIGDAISMPWWPVSANLSASQSILYAADSLTIKPLEIVLVGVIAVWLINRRLTPNAPPVIYGPHWRPLLLFSGTMLTGMIWGISQGGDLRIAIFEVTPMIYIPLVYLAATNLFTSLAHYHKLMTGILIALTIQSIHGLIRLPVIRAMIAEDASPLEHTAVLHMNLMLLMFVATLWFGSKREGKRLWLFLILVPTIALYLDTQRRAGVVALIIGGITLTVVLFTRNREKFWKIIPVMLLITAVYSAGFWNSDSQVAFPAQAIKTVIQPDASNDKDASSDLYREIENFDLNATIRSNPLLGIGFGREFLQPIPLPDISFFEFASYIPHNTVLWVWTKLGFFGFVSFLYMIALGLAAGVRAAVRSNDPDDATLYVVVAAYLPMALVVAFVEIAFDATTTVLFGLALALTGSSERFLVRAEADEERLANEADGSGSNAADADGSQPDEPATQDASLVGTRDLESV